jgi:uncharacterized protein YdeI (YjbR/CyaY-like superfamily)
MNTGSVESYFADGCGRCDLYRTPQCKVHRWAEPLVALRALLQTTELSETMKWGSPCYTVDGTNVLMLTSYKDFCCLSFFRGALLTDPDGLLVPPGPNSQAGRLLKFTSIDDVHAQRDAALRFVEEAIALTRAGTKVAFAKNPEPMPEELQAALDADPTLQDAFDALTPGRQRSYILHVGGAKQAKTRVSRAGKVGPKIRSGKGFNER